MGPPATQVNVPQLVPLDAIWCGAADFGSADASEGCFCGDAGAFVIKGATTDPHIPHSEWFCSSLAQIVGVPQVPYSLVRHTDGSLHFGSLWMKGKTPDWWTLALAGAIDFASLADDLAKIYVFDLFINNEDRHVNNFMVVPEGQGHRVYSFDYSRAWLVNGFPLPDAIMSDANIATVNIKSWLLSNFGAFISMDVANVILDRIAGIDEATIRRIIGDHPRDWLTQANEDAIIEWWTSGMATARVETIRAGLQNGDFL
ncbi:HipA family kinase [Rhizobium sp. Rhizsp82]|uniref:HipA family kinase n=1 Tax=Rhizobium sp. Rhizsp82 TaxID=3243057 RepID=UPI0039B680D2